MTDEEKKAIKILEEFKKTGFHMLSIKYDKDRVHTNKMVENSIETVLNLIQKQEEIIKRQSYTNKKMKKKLDNYRHNYRKYLNKNKKQEKTLINETIKYIDEHTYRDMEEYDFVFNQGVKSVKNKIIEKIEELNKEYNKYTGYKGLEFSRTGLINSQIRVLKELLLEE